MQANMKTKDEMNMNQNNDEDDWESAEEDAPAIRLEELLDNLKIDDKNEDEAKSEESKEE